MKFINIKYLILCTTYLILLSSCKRKCQDERADNYGEGKRNKGCNYQFADNWHQDIIVDSFIVNGENIQLRDVFKNFDGANYYEDEKEYSTNFRNSYTAFIDTSVYLADEIKSIEIIFSIPVASTYSNKIDLVSYELQYYDENKNGISIEGNNETFTFLKKEAIDGVEYEFYKAQFIDLDQDVIMNKYNFLGCLYNIKMSNSELDNVIINYVLYITSN